MKIFLVNDTSSYHFGSAMVVKTIKEELVKRGATLIGSSTKDEQWVIHRATMLLADLVIVNGEGSLHSGNRSELLSIALEFPCALINFSIDKYPLLDTYPLSYFRLVSVRESLSAYAWRKALKEPILITPDLSLMQDVQRVEATEDIGYFDAVNKVGAKWLTPFDWRHEAPFVEVAQTYKRWCTGRFHGICLAMITNTPFSAYHTHTHKNQGIMFDAGLSEYIYPTREEAALNVPMVAPPQQAAYLLDARKRITLLFDRILTL